MAARSSWKGFIKLSLVSVPVKAYTAHATAQEIRLNQLHEKCNNRIKYKKFCPEHGEVTQDEIVSGYEYSTDDLWGDAVNVASRIETAGKAGLVNISKSTYELVRDFFDCKPRGEVKAKNRGKIGMYFVEGIRKNLAEKDEPFIPNDRFWELYRAL